MLEGGALVGDALADVACLGPEKDVADKLDAIDLIREVSIHVSYRIKEGGRGYTIASTQYIPKHKSVTVLELYG